MAAKKFLTGLYAALFAAVAFGFSAELQARETLPNPYDAFRLADMTPDNQLPLLGDRFRIDDHVDEITMIFFRQTQSRPVVLILPDGSKWYSSRHPDHVAWETGPGFDQVRITSPMRGPWQVSGELRPESRLMVISDLKFHAEPLPDLIFRGERLTIQGRFTEAGKPIDQADFRNAIDMRMYLVSTNNEAHENFGLNPRQVGEFLDDGRGMDARARDGIFTGEVKFDAPTGEYIPSYEANTPLYQRTFEQSPIMLQSLPVVVSSEPSQIVDRSHRIHFHVDDDYFDPQDVVIRGEVEFPNGEIQLIDIRTAQGDSLEQRVPNYVNGVFTVRAMLYATLLQDGREIIAKLEEHEFIAREPEPPGPTEEELMRQRIAEREARVAQQVEEEAAKARQQRWLLIAILIANVVLVVGWVAWLWRRRMSTSAATEARKKPAKKR